MSKTEFEPEHIANYCQMGGVSGYCSSGKDVYPSSYLEFAKEDLSEGSERRNHVNAVSNAKRAFHFQVEMLCDAFGWQVLYKTKYKGFPERLEFLEKCGILSPNILRKLNKKRNEIEHDYYIPSIEEVEDYLDIVELFLMATKDILDRFPEHIDYELMKDSIYDSSLDLPETITVIIAMSKGEIFINLYGKEIKLQINQSNYFVWLSAVMRQYVL